MKKSAPKLEEIWMPGPVCVVIPTKDGLTMTHQTGGVCCVGSRIRGVPHLVVMSEQEARAVGNWGMEMYCCLDEKERKEPSEIVARIIKRFELPLEPVEMRDGGSLGAQFEKERKSLGAKPAMDKIFIRTLGYDNDVSHEAWQWCRVKPGGCTRCPILSEFVGKTVLLAYPNSD